MLLGIVQRERPDLLGSFPVAPSPPRWPATVPRFGRRGTRRFLRALDRVAPRTAVALPPHGLSSGIEQFQSLFDAAPLGQFLGGTPGGDGPGIAYRYHWIGRDLLDGRFAIEWEQDHEGRRIPRVIDRYDGGRAWKLNNLHVHSKRLEDFV
jgi:hypothetical protein